jgi:hypothetical protein
MLTQLDLINKMIRKQSVKRRDARYIRGLVSCQTRRECPIKTFLHFLKI